MSDIHQVVNRRFRNKCDIVEEPNSPSEHGIRVKFFSLISRNFSAFSLAQNFNNLVAMFNMPGKNWALTRIWLFLHITFIPETFIDDRLLWTPCNWVNESLCICPSEGHYIMLQAILNPGEKMPARWGLQQTTLAPGNDETQARDPLVR